MRFVYSLFMRMFVCVCTCMYIVGPRYIELFLHSTEETGGGPQTGAGATGGMKYGQPPQTQQGWGDNRAQVRR